MTESTVVNNGVADRRLFKVACNQSLVIPEAVGGNLKRQYCEHVRMLRSTYNSWVVGTSLSRHDLMTGKDSY